MFFRWYKRYPNSAQPVRFNDLVNLYIFNMDSHTWLPISASDSTPKDFLDLGHTPRLALLNCLLETSETMPEDLEPITFHEDEDQHLSTCLSLE